MELLRGAMDLPPHDYRTDPRLMEADYGTSHGRPWAEAHAIRKASANGDDAWNTPHPGDESRAQLYARAVAFLHSIRRDTVVVSHGGPVRMIRGALLKLDNDEIVGFAALNAGVIEISAAGERLHGR
jgi:probable phosphoglycerate mutase